MGKHLEQALAFCVRPPVPNWLKQIITITIIKQKGYNSVNCFTVV